MTTQHTEKNYLPKADYGVLSINPIVRTYTTSGSPATWTKPAGLKYVVVECVGGGGGGPSYTGSGTSYAGVGAGAGYSKKLIAASSLGTTETVTTGIGGTANAGTGTGGTGGTSSFGSFLSATGGSGDTSAPGSGTGGDINLTGLTGGGQLYSPYVATVGIPIMYGNAGMIVSGSRSGYGVGGRGRNQGTGVNAENGLDGVVIVTEYYNY